MLERLKKKGFEVLFALDQIDEIALQGVGKFGDFDVIDAAKENADLGEQSDEEKAEAEAAKEELKPVTEFLKETLGSRVDLRAKVAAFFGAEPAFSFLAGAPRKMRADASQDGEASSLYGLYPRTHAPVAVFDYFNAENDARVGVR